MKFLSNLNIAGSRKFFWFTVFVALMNIGNLALQIYVYTLYHH